MKKEPIELDGPWELDRRAGNIYDAKGDLILVAIGETAKEHAATASPDMYLAAREVVKARDAWVLRPVLQTAEDYENANDNLKRIIDKLEEVAG